MDRNRKSIHGGGVVLLIRRLSAVFGRLDHETLELREGLNILQLPNEAGKSTWSALLAAMLYGIDSRQRDRAGFIADKNRFAPWNGAAMQGRMDCSAGGRELTITRETRRQAAPLGEFTACYAGTADPVPGLTALNCGETLLGVPREVYERSAFIRQAGLPVSQDAGLERRIAALITTGEEDTSYIEASAALKKQLNRRRHNKTGELPAAEAESAEVRRQLQSLTELESRSADARRRQDALARQEAALTERLEQLARWEAQERCRAAEAEEAAARSAGERAAALRRALEEAHIPENDAIGRLRGAIVNLETTRKSVEKARDARDEALKTRLRAESAANESPFAGESAEEARRESAAPPKVHVSMLLPALAAAALLALPALAGFVWNLPMLSFAGVLPAVLVAFLLGRRARAKARAAALERRYGTADPAKLAALAETYGQMLAALDAACAAAAAASATYDALYASLSSNEQGILLEVRRFAPAAFDIPSADAALRSCALRRREVSEADAAAAAAQLRSELTRRQLDGTAAPAGDGPALPPAPGETRESLEAQAAEVRAARAEARSEADRLAGQAAALGERAVLLARAEELDARTAALQGEYDAISLALEVLDGANTELQGRFSPELARRAAAYFARLTDGRYSGVILDRAFRLAAEPAGESVYRDAQLLSAGASDQLYLAVRLAVCDLVLPQETAAPLVLDDALANFDDARCAAALELLGEIARTRQVLLFTCHSREGRMAQKIPGVFIPRLTNETEMV